MQYAEIYPPEDPDHHPTAVSKTMFVESIGRDEASMLVERLQLCDATLRVALLRVLRGAVAGPGRCHGVRPPSKPHHGQHRGVP
jgi:hypothetical protein